MSEQNKQCPEFPFFVHLTQMLVVSMDIYGIWINVTKTGIYTEREIFLARSAIPRNLLSMILFQKKMNSMKVSSMKKKQKRNPVNGI